MDILHYYSVKTPDLCKKWRCNIVSAAEFRFTEVGLHVKWNLTKKLVFRKEVGE